MARKRAPDYSDPSCLGGLLQRTGYQRYAEYLASEHWQGLKARYRQSDRPKRCACGARRRLHLHHLTYERLGAESLTDLILLCADCHDAAHRKNAKRKRHAPARPVKRKRPRHSAAMPVARKTAPSHLRPLPYAVETPKPEPVKRVKSKPKVGEPKPWDKHSIASLAAREPGAAKRSRYR